MVLGNLELDGSKWNVCGASETHRTQTTKKTVTAAARNIREIYTISLWGARWPCSYGSDLHKTRKTSFFFFIKFQVPA